MYVVLLFHSFLKFALRVPSIKAAAECHKTARAPLYIMTLFMMVSEESIFSLSYSACTLYASPVRWCHIWHFSPHWKKPNPKIAAASSNHDTLQNVAMIRMTATGEAT
jgi:hypothetical protein